MKKLFLFLMPALFCAPFSNALTLDQYKTKPRLILLLVVDQFRADFFTRLGKKFLPAGVYSDKVEVIDLPMTLSFILGQLPPAKASGRVLKEIF